jgi:hypothetical protein
MFQDMIQGQPLCCAACLPWLQLFSFFPPWPPTSCCGRCGFPPARKCRHGDAMLPCLGSRETVCCCTAASPERSDERPAGPGGPPRRSQCADRGAWRRPRRADLPFLGRHAGDRLLRPPTRGDLPRRSDRAGFPDAEGLSAFETRRAAHLRSPRVVWAGLLAGFRGRGVTGDAEAARDSIVGTVVRTFANPPLSSNAAPNTKVREGLGAVVRCGMPQRPLRVVGALRRLLLRH